MGDRDFGDPRYRDDPVEAYELTGALCAHHGDDVKRGKPNPEAYLLAAAKLDVRPERCVVVEDAPAGVSAARAAGMRVIAVATTHSQIELREADIRVERLVNIQISRSDVSRGGRLTVRVAA